LETKLANLGRKEGHEEGDAVELSEAELLVKRSSEENGGKLVRDHVS